jgi:threonine/homoserine/homoserine lactone efflux protein
LILVTHLVLGIVLSFVGLIPFGAINITTAEEAINKGMKSALLVAAGAAIVAFVQAFVALKFSSLFTENPTFDLIFRWVSIPVFIGISVYFLTKRPKPKQAANPAALKGGLLKGIIVSSLNMLAIPYWVFYTVYLTCMKWIDPGQNINILIFGIGVIIGSLFILAIYARMGVYTQKNAQRISKVASKGAGIIFLFFAVMQLMILLIK